MSLIVFAYTINVSALITPDVMKTQILKVYNQNIIAINRGLEDGIFKASHIKITSRDGFIARGISLKSNMMISYIKIYRVVRPELVSKDTLYDLKDMHQSEIPKDLKYLKSASLPFNLKEINPKDMQKQLKLQQKRLAKFDLPESIKKAQEKEVTETDQFLERNLDYTQFNKDISNWNVQVFVAPYQNQTLTNQTNSHFGFIIGNNGKKYEFELRHQDTQTEIIDPYNEESIKSSRSRTSLFFDINRISENWSYFVYAQREQARIGRINNPENRFSYGLAGFKYHLIDSLPEDATTGFTVADISYIPLYETYSFDLFSDKDDPTSAVITDQQRYVRHAFRFHAQAVVGENTIMKVKAWWRPAQNLETGAFDTLNSLTDINATLSTRIVRSLYLDYSMRYLYDINNQDFYGLSPTNLINTVQFRYKVDLNI